MTGILEISLTPEAQRFSVTLAGIVYKMRVTYCEAGEGAWILDIGTQAGAVIIAGIPLLVGGNILGQYKYIGIGGGLYVVTSRNSNEDPTYNGLGNISRLYFISNL